MIVSISQEDKEVLEDLFESLVSFKQTLLQLSLMGIKGLKKILVNFIISLGDFSPSEIREHGLEEILLGRAMSFFGLGDTAQNKDNGNDRRKVSPKSIVRRIIGVVLIPVYLLIIITLYFRRKKTTKNVKNRYKT
jgi:hypothetical protein